MTKTFVLFAFLIGTALPLIGQTSLGDKEPKTEQKKYEVLKDCVFVEEEYYDGDGFCVSHNGELYIFRLYYVDSPESDDRHPDRIREQGKDFNLNQDQILKAGDKAKKFAGEYLKGAKLTIHTKWKDAKGSSKMKRYFAFVRKDRDDYAETLVENGWARVFGEADKTPEGKSEEATWGKLQQLERKAKSQKKGAWNPKNLEDAPSESKGI